MGKKPFKIAVLASTRGTDLQVIIDEIKKGKMPGVKLEVVISNKRDCYALERANEQGFDTVFIDPKGKKRAEFDREMMKVLDEREVELIVLVGFMRILSDDFVKHFKYRIINVHPALLPKYGGKDFFGNNVHEEVLASGDKETGMTIHFVDEGVDTGPIIHQATVEIKKDDTVNSLKHKVQELEKKWYPEVIRWIQHGKVVVAEED